MNQFMMITKSVWEIEMHVSDRSNMPTTHRHFEMHYKISTWHGMCISYIVWKWNWQSYKFSNHLRVEAKTHDAHTNHATVCICENMYGKKPHTLLVSLDLNTMVQWFGGLNDSTFQRFNDSTCFHRVSSVCFNFLWGCRCCVCVLGCLLFCRDLGFYQVLPSLLWNYWTA